jgi:hypothetical protein
MQEAGGICSLFWADAGDNAQTQQGVENTIRVIPHGILVL